jgi:hypothetical protein
MHKPARKHGRYAHHAGSRPAIERICSGGTTRCKSPRVSKGDMLNSLQLGLLLTTIDGYLRFDIALAYARACAS